MTADPRDGRFCTGDGDPPTRLDRLVKAARDLSWGAVRDLIRRGKVTVQGGVQTDPGALVGPGTAWTIQMAAPRADRGAGQAPALDRARILFADPYLVVVDKPPGLNSVPWGEERDALDVRLGVTLGQPVRVVHRLDRDTSGAMLFALTAEAEGRLTHLLRRHDVRRRYLALAHGAVAAGTIRTFLDEDRGDGRRGSVPPGRGGKEAITEVAVVRPLRGATLVACTLRTGRTHQIRIHLAERGHMLLGERGYVRDHRGPVLPAPRIMLHSATLAFAHPISGAPLEFTVPPPDDFAGLAAALAMDAGDR